jgi:hypothetical protein
VRSSNIRFDEDRLIINLTVNKMRKDINYLIINKNRSNMSKDKDISSDNQEV